MSKEIEDLIEIYEHKDEHRQRIRQATTRVPIPDIAEALTLQERIQFGKNRQRAELLKQNEMFSKELEAIKQRLGKRFFDLAETIINDDSPSSIYASVLEAVSHSAFADPEIVFVHTEYLDPGVVEHHYYRPGTPLATDGAPIYDIEPSGDPLFDGFPLEYVIIDPVQDWDKAERIGTQAFRDECKLKVYEHYLDKWIAFLDKWHISLNWNGDLQYLHVHSLPSVIVELDQGSHNLPVVIRLGAWATYDDVKDAWPKVEQTLKEAHVYRERESENFLRDYIWYRQNKEDSLSPASIAREWAKMFPKEIDLEIIEKLTRDEDAFEAVPLKERLEEVLSGDPAMAELKGRFIEARKAYISSGLRDKVKKSIKKTEEKIKRFGSDEWDRNRQRLLRPARQREEK